jgi:excinuclease ABC subunit B
MKRGGSAVKMTDAERRAEIERLERRMKEAAKMLEFEIAAELRDQIILLKGERKK